jgi:hypothetical protein
MQVIVVQKHKLTLTIQYLFWDTIFLGNTDEKWYLVGSDREHTAEWKCCRVIGHIYGKSSVKRSGFSHPTVAWEVSETCLWTVPPRDIPHTHIAIYRVTSELSALCVFVRWLIRQSECVCFAAVSSSPVTVCLGIFFYNECLPRVPLIEEIGRKN